MRNLDGEGGEGGRGGGRRDEGDFGICCSVYCFVYLDAILDETQEVATL